MDDINERKLHFTLTEKLCEAVIKSVRERYDAYDKLSAKYESIDEEKVILAKIISDLKTLHNALKQLRAMCHCHSDYHHNNTTNKEQILAKLEEKLIAVAAVVAKVVDISVNKLPPNLRAVMLKISRDESSSEIIVDCVNDDERKLIYHDQSTTNGGGDQTKIENNNDNENMDKKSDEELCSTVKLIRMRINDIKKAIVSSKQLNEVAEELRREYEVSNCEFKQMMAMCHCAEYKKCLEETVERTSSDLKRWEKQYSILKEGTNAKNESANQQQSEEKLTTTIERVDSPEEEVVSGNQVKQDTGENKHNASIIAINEKLYTCRVIGCDYVGLNFAAFLSHRRHQHNRKKKKSYSVVKRKSVAVDHKVSNNTNNDSNNNKDKTTPIRNKQFKCQFPGCGFTGEDGVELKTHVQSTHKSNERSVNPYNCYFPSCDFVGFNRVMLRKHIASQHNHYHNEKTPKLFACEYRNCKYTGSTTKKGLRIHLKTSHGKRVAKYRRRGQLINRSLIKTQIEPTFQKPIFANLMSSGSTSADSPYQLFLADRNRQQISASNNTSRETPSSPRKISLSLH